MDDLYTSNQIDLQLTWLRATRDELRSKLDDVDSRIAVLRLQEDRLKHPCVCVALNRDLGILDTVAQAAAGRQSWGVGFVSNTLSALKNCPICHGSGIPENATLNNEDNGKEK